MTASLECNALEAGHNGLPFVRTFDIAVGSGEVVALLGPNGAGKTTILSTLAGLIPRLGGAVRVLGSEVPSGHPTTLARRGVVLVPDDRSLFTTLTTRENLTLGSRGGKTTADVLEWFPALANRLDVRAGALSGGEQQMLAMARALVQCPKVLLIDELSMGLAPVIVRGLLSTVRSIADDEGVAVLLVEQHVPMALEVADRAVVLVHGDVALVDSTDKLRADPSLVERAYFDGALQGSET